MSDYLRMSLRSRLAYWKKRAAGNAPEYRDWRKTAKGSIGYMVRPDGFGTGYNGEGHHRQTVYVAFSAQLKEQDAHEVARTNHTGWFTDVHHYDTAIGIIAKLPHNRWLAGYRLTMNDERVYFADIHDSAEDAARAADSHAETIADAEREYSHKFQEAQDLQSEVEELKQRAARCFALRNHPKMGESCRYDLQDYILPELRDKMEKLKSDYSDFL